MTKMRISKLKETAYSLALVINILTGSVISNKDVEHKNDKSYNIVQSVLMGISWTVGSGFELGDSSTQNDDTDKKTVEFLDSGPTMTPAFGYKGFTYTTYSPKLFNRIRKLSGIYNNDFVFSLCNLPLKKMGSAGDSGSVFYKTGDGKFIIRSVRTKEASVLQKSLPLLTKHLEKNPNTLLTKYLGLYSYKRNFWTQMFVVMNNVLAIDVNIHQMYDIKGTKFRTAPESEKMKKLPVFRDVEFLSDHPNGIYLEETVHTKLSQIIKKDCELLVNLNVTDYSLLLAIHNIDLATKQETTAISDKDKLELSKAVFISPDGDTIRPIAVEVDIKRVGIPGLNTKREKLVIFMGIIDFLMHYGKQQQALHFFSVGARVSTKYRNVMNTQLTPDSYAERFHTFLTESVLVST